MKVLDLMVAMHHRTPYLRTKLGHFYKINGKSQNVHTVLQIWVTWASKITSKNLQLCSIKLKEATPPVTSHAAALSVTDTNGGAGQALTWTAC